jgi:hypothetical protein
MQNSPKWDAKSVIHFVQGPWRHHQRAELLWNPQIPLHCHQEKADVGCAILPRNICPHVSRAGLDSSGPYLGSAELSPECLDLSCNLHVFANHPHLPLFHQGKATEPIKFRKFMSSRQVRSCATVLITQGVLHCATSRKVVGSIPVAGTGIFQLLNPSGRIVALGSTQPLTETSTRNPSWG